jgi:thiamine thiazole synthase
MAATAVNSRVAFATKSANRSAAVKAFGASRKNAMGRRASSSVKTRAGADAGPFDGYTFKPIRERDVSREMSKRYFQDLYKYADADVIIVGSGSAGLACAYELSKHPEISVALIEQSVSPGGGAWLGGQLFSSMVVRKPADRFLKELGLEYEEEEDYVILKHAAQYTSTIMSKVLDAPNVKLFNATCAEDLIVKDNRVAGVVTNWSTVTLFGHDTQSCMDPNVLEAKVVVSACGHDGPFGATGVKRLQELGLVDKVPGMFALDMNKAEDAVVANTREVYPGMIITGMEVAEVDGCPRMGPTFGAMFISGQKAAYLALKKLGKETEALNTFTSLPKQESMGGLGSLFQKN